MERVRASLHYIEWDFLQFFIPQILLIFFCLWFSFFFSILRVFQGKSDSSPHFPRSTFFLFFSSQRDLQAERGGRLSWTSRVSFRLGRVCVCQMEQLNKKKNQDYNWVWRFFLSNMSHSEVRTNESFKGVFLLPFLPFRSQSPKKNKKFQYCFDCFSTFKQKFFRITGDLLSMGSFLCVNSSRTNFGIDFRRNYNRSIRERENKD